MTRASKHGAFISIEGGEGVGKSTQIRLLASQLEGLGYSVRTTREPGGAEGSEMIRNLVLTGELNRWEPMTEALLVTAARAEHVERLIKPALEAGKIVISDRFFDSSVAYQGKARGVGMKKVRDLQTLALGDFAPDLTLVFDLPVNVGLTRAMAREAENVNKEDRFERMGEAFHTSIIEAFHDIAVSEPERCRIINADCSVNQMHSDVVQVVTDFLEAKGIEPT